LASILAYAKAFNPKSARKSGKGAGQQPWFSRKLGVNHNRLYIGSKKRRQKGVTYLKGVGVTGAITHRAVSVLKGNVVMQERGGCFKNAKKPWERAIVEVCFS
jgi:hypothetical protein